MKKFLLLVMLSVLGAWLSGCGTLPALPAPPTPPGLPALPAPPRP